MRIIGIIIGIIMYFSILAIVPLYKEFGAIYGIAFMLGLIQAFMGLYFANKFYKWFKSNLK